MKSQQNNEDKTERIREWSNPTRYSRVVSFQPIFFKLTKNVNAALMLSQAVYWMERTGGSTIDGKDAFYKSAEEWQQEICLTPEQQATARKILREIVSPSGEHIWVERLQHLPAKLYYRVSKKALDEAVAAIEAEE